MRCPVCDLEIEEDAASFCPRCGTLLPAAQAERPSQGGLPPARPLHNAPTRVSPGASAPRRAGWGSNYGRPADSPETPATHASLYPSGQPQAPPTRRPLPPETPPGASGKKRLWLILGGVLILLLVFASGVGVTAYFLGGHGNQAPASKAASPTLAPSPTATPIERVIFTDPLSAPTNPWQVDSAHCQFKNGSYHIIADFICFAPIGVQSDVAISVQVAQASGSVNAFFGITFRYTSRGNYYDFLVNSNSLWTFDKVVNNTTTELVAEVANAAIKPGLNTVNTLLVRVKGSRLDFFVNGTKVGQGDDTLFSAGLIGLIGSENADVAFNTFQVATLT